MGPSSGLNVEQVKQLADRLLGTNDNVYTVAKSMFGHDDDKGDELFNDLSAYGQVFKCETCGTWQLIDCQSADPDMCEDCEADQ